ncbi:MAG: RNA polymerase sigma factor, partial [Candidatus Omnitrophica bacterium]|nr:RNA polymerase sigma factor [Candidatus Omnitrophota bacterium]
MDKQHQHFLKLLKPIELSVQAYVRHLAWSRNDVEDIFQTALLNAFKKFDTYEEGTNFKAWFFQFVTYAAFNANRKHEKISSHELSVEPEHVAEARPIGFSLEQNLKQEEILKDPDSILANIDEEIRQAIRRLSIRRRSVFLLKAVADLSYIEIS